MRKTILVTGGAGYIGSTVTKFLVKKNYRTVVLDNLSTGHLCLVYNSLFYKGDLRDKEVLKRIFSENKIDAVMHFAGLSSVAESVRDPKLYYENNILGSLNLFSCMLAANVKKIIFSSSAAVYGVPQKLPIDEEHPCKPLNPYGKSKLVIEETLSDYFKSYGLRSLSLRYFNACGTEKDYELGEIHSPETHLMPLAVKAAIEQGEVLSVYGTDYDTSDGTCIRDYIHVCDLAEAHIKALESLLGSNICLSLNLSNNKGFSVLEIIKAVESVTGKKIKIKYEKRRKGDPPILFGSSQRARKFLAWEPRYVGLSEMIGTVYEWTCSERLGRQSELRKSFLNYLYIPR